MIKKFSWLFIFVILQTVNSVPLASEEKNNDNSTITLAQVEECKKRRDDCLNVCGPGWDQCKEDCPVCPEIKYVQPAIRKVVVQGDQSSYVNEVPLSGGNNITTVIKLTNLINNTNIVDMPTNINTTNLNHIHIYQNDSSTVGGKFGLGYNKGGDCCLAVQPKTCTASTEGYRCHHKRHKTCGQQCTARVIHSQVRRQCHGGSSCSYGVGYVSQPRRPRCVYTSQWPHVSCGGNNEQNCEGCYDHYGYGAQNYHDGNIPERCSPCYDDAFDIGPLYRRGPVLRPFYYHQPPCFMTGNCNMPFCGPYGCYGHEMIDPVWGYGPQYGYGDIEDFGIEDNQSSQQEGDWGVEMHKCQVVENDGTTTIKNCTEIPDNPYSGSPAFASDIHRGRTASIDQGSIETVLPKVHKRHTIRNKRKHKVVYDD